MKRYPFPKTEAKVSVTKADVYRFRWPDYSSWAIFTVCDDTNEFSIQSDWGSFSFRWGDSLGDQTLTEFLATCDDPTYILRKFLYIKQDDTKDIFDAKATQKHWDELIQEHRDHLRWSHISGQGTPREQELEIRSDMAEFLDQAEGGHPTCVDLAIHDISDRLWKFLGQEPHEHLRYRESTTVTICRDELLPRFLQYLKDHVVPARAAS
jgi:hypothetical protein